MSYALAQIHGVYAKRSHRVSTSENGWTNDHLGFEWFRKTFVLQAKARLDDPDEYILLVFDGHDSHVTDALVEYGYKNRIVLYSLPPHTTHKLQPLDALVFVAVQRLWLVRAQDCAAGGQPITVRNLVREYMGIQ